MQESQILYDLEHVLHGISHGKHIKASIPYPSGQTYIHEFSNKKYVSIQDKQLSFLSMQLEQPSKQSTQTVPSGT